MKQDFDELAKNYDAELKTSLGIFAGNNIDKFARYKIDALALFCKSPQSILEFGCGTGRNLPFLRQKFPNAQIFASDISEKSLEIAKNDNPSVIFAKIDSPKELADAHKDIELVFVSGVFHHIPFEEHKNYFEALNKILAQNGKIVIFEHNPHNPLTSRIFKNSKIDLGCKMLSPKYLKKTFGGRLSFRGLISTAGPLAYGSVEETVADVREKLAVMMDGGGYHFAPSHCIQDNSPPENVVAMYQAGHRYGVYG